VDGVDPAIRKVVTSATCAPVLHDEVPYVPPHSGMSISAPDVAAKAIKFRKGEIRFRDRLLSSPTRSASLPRYRCGADGECAKRNGTARADAKVIGVHRSANCRRTADAFSQRRAGEPHACGEGRRAHAGKVAIFATCYVNYNERIGYDLIKLLDHNESHVIVRRSVLRHAKLELGDLESVARLKQ